MPSASLESRRGAGYRVELEADEALAKLGAAVERLEHPAPLYDIIGAMLVTSTQQRFERQAGPDGTSWPPSFRAMMEGGRTLFDGGDLFRSLTHEATDQGVEVGTNVLYAAIHQFGGTIRAKDGGMLHFSIGGADVFVREVNMPARPFLGLDAADTDAIEELAADYIVAPLVAGGADAG
jgi:phage virion morphogenesis protein